MIARRGGRAGAPTVSILLVALVASSFVGWTAARGGAGLAVGGLVAAGVALVAALPSRVTASHCLGAFAVYLVVEDAVLSALPSGLVPVFRFLPEAAALLLAVYTYLSAERARLRVRRLVIVATVVLVGAGVAVLLNGTPLLRAAIGVRAELRFLSLAILAAAYTYSRADASRVARWFVYAMLGEALIGLGQFTFGGWLTTRLAPTYEVVVAGQVVNPRAALRDGTIFGTFGNYNEFGTMLAFAIVVLVALGPAGVQMRRPAYRLALVTLCGALLTSGSREGVLGAMAGGLVVLIARGVASALRAALVVGIAVVAIAMLASPAADVAPSRSISTRWAQLLQPTVYTADSGSNFRLSLLSTEWQIARSHDVLYGFGPGSITDRTAVAAGDNPLTATRTGREALAFGYQYDGNWGLILVEFGVVGLVGFACLLASAVPRAGGDEAWRRAIVGLVAAVIVFGFFESILQQDQVTGMFWMLVGIAASSVPLAPSARRGGQSSGAAAER